MRKTNIGPAVFTSLTLTGSAFAQQADIETSIGSRGMGETTSMNNR